MTKKSRRKRKQSPQRKRGDIATTTVAPQQVVAPTYQPAAPVVKEPAPTVVHHPHIGAELRRIGMLAGILLTALVVLASILS